MSGVLPHTLVREHFSCFLAFYTFGFFFFWEKKIVLAEERTVEERGERWTKRGEKNFFEFFSPHVR
jgi:hypothetical protein